MKKLVFREITPIDYFQGSTRPIVSVQIWKGQTYSEFLTELMESIDLFFDFSIFEIAKEDQFFSMFFPKNSFSWPTITESEAEKEFPQLMFFEVH